MPLFSAIRPLERPTDNFVQRRAVGRSPDWHRINALPRVDWRQRVETEGLVDVWTRRFRGRFDLGQKLLPEQAGCLQVASEENGLVASLSVGSGKTLLSFLLPAAIPCERPVLLLKASLIDKTRAEWSEYAKAWDLPRIPVLISYESLGPVSGKTLLDRLDPDLLIFDESQKTKDPKASRSRKIRRFLEKGTCNVCILTGSLSKRSVKDFAHHCAWALGPGSPLPVDPSELENWSAALDEKLMLGERIRPGALLDWADPDDHGDELSRGRRAFFRRFSSAPGVVCSTVRQETLGVGISITGHRIDWPEDGPVGQAFEKLRTERVLPDGQELVDAIEWYQHAQELAHGYYLHWRDPAPIEWLAARKGWFSYCREILSRSRTLDSPDEIAKAYPMAEEWLRWKAVRKDFKPDTVPVWLDTSLAEMSAEWLDQGGIVFSNNTCFGQLVAKYAGVPYFGAEGLDEAGRSIVGWQGERCAASFKANFEGRNLQHLCRMLIPMPPPNGLQWEQLLGRLHRQNQKRDVLVDVFFGCGEAFDMFEQSVRDSNGIHNDLLGGESKLSIAARTIPPRPTTGWQWLRSAE